jgi:hypothetical protein
MNIFDITTFQIIRSDSVVVSAQVGWLAGDLQRYNYSNAEDEIQEIEWTIQHVERIDDALELAELIYDNGGIESDNIKFGKDEVTLLAGNAKGWGESDVEVVLDSLLKIRVDMIDGKEKSDYFFLHF